MNHSEKKTYLYILANSEKKTYLHKISPDIACFRAECESTNHHQHTNGFWKTKSRSYNLGWRFFANYAAI